MAKYAVHTKWSWPDGVPSAETMQEWHREHRSNTKAEDIIWFKIDENTHQSVIIYSSEADAQKESESSRQSYLITTSQHSLQSNPSFRCLQDLRKEGYCKDHHQSQALPRKGQLQLEHIWHQDLT